MFRSKRCKLVGKGGGGDGSRRFFRDVLSGTCKEFSQYRVLIDIFPRNSIYTKKYYIKMLTWFYEPPHSFSIQPSPIQPSCLQYAPTFLCTGTSVGTYDGVSAELSCMCVQRGLKKQSTKTRQESSPPSENGVFLAVFQPT